MATSPFFHPPPTAAVDSLAILHLKRDSLLPLKLRAAADDGYAEGAVTNTRFGSFPHSTLIGVDWGSQVRASKVDTGTRGRKGKHASKSQQQPKDETPTPVTDQGQQPLLDEQSRKRKRDSAAASAAPTKKLNSTDPDSGNSTPQQSAIVVPIEASSGFIHVLPPTPETWTASLDHRTQVVYTPDYSYILQRLRVRPGDSLIEAGAGSGSFTHAACRAVFNGYLAATPPPRRGRRGQVYSYEFHEPRVQTLRDELIEHGLADTVTLTHRDVCADGFSLPSSQQSPPENATHPNVTAVFLDLPAPWLALPHLSRDAPGSPLSPTQAIHLCTFSPCIEQVMATVAEMRRRGWLSISMVEVANRRLDVRRERVGLREEGLRGVHASAASVEEAVARLREVEGKTSAFHAAEKKAQGSGAGAAGGKAQGEEGGEDGMNTTPRISSKQHRLNRNRKEVEARKLYKEGTLVHRTEPEVKTHTSYLVFAVLPRAWTAEDEERCLKQYGGAPAESSGDAATT